jgi:hypothetical protein
MLSNSFSRCQVSIVPCLCLSVPARQSFSDGGWVCGKNIPRVLCVSSEAGGENSLTHSQTKAWTFSLAEGLMELIKS